MGKGSFLNSPLMKQFGDERIAAGERRLVIDLGACTGMDSTFMGTLAGMATRIAGNHGTLEIADIDDRGQQSLEDLGIDAMMEIRRPGAPWSGRLDAVRADLAPHRAPAELPDLNGRAQHVLQAHQTLARATPENSKRFAGVISVLRDDLAAKNHSNDS